MAPQDDAMAVVDDPSFTNAPPPGPPRRDAYPPRGPMEHDEAPDGREPRVPPHLLAPRDGRGPRPGRHDMERPGPRGGNQREARQPFLADPLLTWFTEAKNAALAAGGVGLVAGIALTTVLFTTVFDGGDDDAGLTLTAGDVTTDQSLDPNGAVNPATDPTAGQVALPTPDLGAQVPTPSTAAPDAAVPPAAGAEDPAVADPTAAPAPAPGDDTAIQNEVLALINVERAAASCPALALDPSLNAAADGHSEDMAANGYFAHEDLAGNGPGARIAASGYAGANWAENIATGFPDPAGVVTGWMNSEGHRANILNCAYVHMGIGYAVGGTGTVYWTQVFGAA
ncbi:MAG: CAP domain-containing protein [Actinomycetota bacterium]